MHVKLIKHLVDLGFQENESRIYLAILELGSGTVTDISKVAGLNRTTGYDILERLCLYGMVHRSVTGKKRIYAAEPLSRLGHFLENKKKQAERRLEDLKHVLPDLQSVHKTELKPVIKFAEGTDAMQNLYLNILDAKSTIYSILNLKNYAETFHEFGDYQLAERMKRGIKQKCLTIDTDMSRWWYDKTYKGNKKREENTQYRWLPWDGRYSTGGEIMIFDDKVIGMLSRASENVAFEITSQTVSDFLKIIFEMAWEKTGETKIETKIKKKN
ncbi:MAG TPA: hypothetical protein DCS29_02245 [Candidatus Magasanikbacteria bacterium]|nr:MAG: hypothetical protein A2479_00565 [Candidatus Magasanikbacteria bacterium RIFOXYC2_FULL_39_8]HAT03577.1 hypothetical protein [Candidatus Magasanikbacteria bacterium]